MSGWGLCYNYKNPKTFKKNMKKEVMYALIGGAAIVGAAVAYHLASQKASDDDADTLDNDLEELGEIQKDEQGFLKFDYFLKIF